MEVQAIPADSDLLLSWDLETYGTNRDACNYVIGNAPLSIEDAKTGKRHGPEAVYRIFSAPFRPELDFGSGMQSFSPAFAKLPAGQQTYTVAIPLRLNFDEKIPAAISIKLPDILVGKDQVSLPVLNLKKVETGGNIKAYVPAAPLPMTNVESITGFGMSANYHRTRGAMAVFHAGASLWYDKRGEIRVASSFSGRDDVKTSKTITPQIWGDVLINLVAGKGIRLADSRVVWITAEGKKIIQQVDPNKLGLAAYRTRLTDTVRLSDETLGPRFIARFPDFHPERLTLSLPRLEVNGHVYPIKPVEFAYKPGGLGLIAWP